MSGLPRQLPYETSGEIWFLNQQLSLHVPYYASVRAASAVHSLVSDLGLPNTNAASRLAFRPAAVQPTHSRWFRLFNWVQPTRIKT